MKAILVAILLGLCQATLGAGAAAARIWYVKSDGSGDVPTIQAGVAAAVSGDTVLVAAGTYTWSQQGTGTPYALVRVERDQTDFAIVGEGGPAATILDGERRGRLFFISGYNEILIQGFTITRGKAPADDQNAGGGLIGHLSSPTIRNCIFVDNTADEIVSGDNRYGSGGAIWYGGVSDLIIEDCTFRDNQAQVGGAIMLVNSTGNTRISGCTLSENRALYRGGALCAINYKFELEDCLVAGNSADNWGGGLYLLQVDAATHPSRVDGCTLVGNDGSTGGGILLRYESGLTVTNTIIAGSTRGGALRVEQGGTFTVGCCDLHGNSGGDTLPAGSVDLGGNFSADPRFCDALGLVPYGLRGDSPCAPGNHPDGHDCAGIGAFPPSCGVQEQRSWGYTKGLFRPRK